MSILPIFVTLFWFLSGSLTQGEGIRHGRQASRMLAPATRQDEEGMHYSLANPASNNEGRQLQRIASICAENPTPFSTSIYITHIGDGTPFRESDLNELLRMVIFSYNEANARNCDPTYRTLTGVGVQKVGYTDSLDYIRLRYDVSGTCDGCLANGVSGIGPIFGGAEAGGTRMLKEDKQQQQQQQQALPNHQNGKRTIKGENHRQVQESRQKGGKNKDDDDEDDDTGKGGKNDVCECENEDMPAAMARGPNPSEFEIALNNAIQTARGNNALSGVVSVGEIFEAGVAGQSTVVATDAVEAAAANCAPTENKEFITDLWVEYNGQKISDNEVIPMEVAILQTYNEMNFISCDLPFFRLVNDVEYIETRANGPDKLQMKFTVKVKCVNCNPPDIQMFGTNVANQPTTIQFRAPAQAFLTEEIDRLQALAPTNFIRTDNVDCVCPLNTQDLHRRAPTEEEFAAVLQTTITALASQNRITSVQNVVQVAEGSIDVECPGEPTEWVSTVFTDFDGLPSLLTESEIEVLEASFRDTYNFNIFQGCDQYFRSITNVRLIPGLTRRRHLQQRPNTGTTTGSAANSSDVVNLQSDLPSVYMVAGTCRNCPRTNSGSFNMFNDAFRKRLLMVDGKLESLPCYSYHSAPKTTLEFAKKISISSNKNETNAEQRQLQLEDQCVCAPGQVPDGPYAPDLDDFVDGYNVQISNFRSRGLITNIRGVLAMEEVPPMLSTVTFCIFYGSLERIGQPDEAAYRSLAFQTGKYYRSRLFDVFDDNPDVTLSAVTIFVDNTALRPDLDAVQVDYKAELIFNQNSLYQPTEDEILETMEGFPYVDYISDYLWLLPNSNSFHQVHTVQFAGTEAVVVDLQMAMAPRTDRSNAVATVEDRRFLVKQLDQYCVDVLKNAGQLVVSCETRVDAGDVEFTDTSHSMLLVEFGASVTFSRETTPPDEDEVRAILRASDLDVFRTQYLNEATPEGTGIFSGVVSISFQPST